MKTKSRYKISLSGDSERMMNSLEKMGYPAKDVFFDALALYDFALREMAKGKLVGSIINGDSEFNSVTTPILQSIYQTVTIDQTDAMDKNAAIDQEKSEEE